MSTNRVWGSYQVDGRIGNTFLRIWVKCLHCGEDFDYLETSYSENLDSYIRHQIDNVETMENLELNINCPYCSKNLIIEEIH